MNKKSVRYFKFQYLFGLACVAAGFSFNSCSKDTAIGANVLPQNSYFYANFSDTATIISTLVLEDTVPTNQLSTNLLGSYNDPIFGPTKASIYTQLSLPSGNNPFPSSWLTGGTYGLNSSNWPTLVLDSAVLAICYGSGTDGYTYGDGSPQTIELYQLKKGITTNTDTSYYSNASIPYNPAPIGSRNVLPNFTTNDTDKYGPYVYPYSPRWRVKINHATALKWIDTGLNRTFTGGISTLDPDTSYNSQASFIRAIPGIYITVNNSAQLPGQGGLWYMNLPGGGSQLLFYCHYSVVTPTNGDSIIYLPPTGFNFQSSVNIFSHFDHDYKSSPFYKNPSGKGHDSVYSPNVNYVQSIGGVKVKLTMPYLKNWSNKVPIIVNKAELDIPIITYDFEGYTPPGNLLLWGINDTSTVVSTATFALPDYGGSNYGGTYDATNQQYVFVITDYIQELIQGKVKNRDFYLFPGNRPVDANRVVLSGVTKTPNQPRIRLKIFYTPLKS